MGFFQKRAVPNLAGAIGNDRVPVLGMNRFGDSRIKESIGYRWFIWVIPFPPYQQEKQSVEGAAVSKNLCDCHGLGRESAGPEKGLVPFRGRKESFEDLEILITWVSGPENPVLVLPKLDLKFNREPPQKWT